jgi:hypothetical protein
MSDVIGASSMRLTGKCAIVTGGDTDTGAAITRARSSSTGG